MAIQTKKEGVIFSLRQARYRAVQETNYDFTQHESKGVL